MSSTDTILSELTGFVARELLDGQNINLDASTPLLEWGVIDSISLLSLLKFMETRFGVDIPKHELTAENLATLSKMTSLVEKFARR